MTETAVSGAGAATMDRDKGKQCLIIGCGPAALIAAHTLEQKWVDPALIRIISKEREPSKIGGAQFLHRPIFGETEPDAQISMMKMGTGLGYAEKVYGNASIGTSFDRMVLEPSEEIEAWSLQAAYTKLWEEYEDRIEIQHVDDEVFAELLDSEEYGQIICTIPPEAYCSHPEHVFEKVPILIGVDPMDEIQADNFVIYNGRLDDAWCRYSAVFGQVSYEFGSEGGKLDYKQMEELAGPFLFDTHLRGVKPTKTDCDCGYGHPTTKLLRVGRFGMWDRKRLLHQVPSQVAEVL
jgi:hypothetical protein